MKTPAKPESCPMCGKRNTDPATGKPAYPADPDFCSRECAAAYDRWQREEAEAGTPEGETAKVENARKVVIDFLTEARLETLFGDGLESEYVLHGFPQVKGLLLCTNEELVAEMEELLGDDGLRGNEASETHVSHDDPAMWEAMEALR